MQIIGLTGGIASGKSTVSNYLKTLGAEILDADAICHVLSEPNQPIWQEYVRRYGRSILNSDQTLDRPLLAERVFAEKEELLWVNRMTHPLIQKCMQEKILELGNAGKDIVILDVPLLYETGWDEMVQKVWVVYVPRDIQIIRLMDRNGYKRSVAEQRIDAQMPLSEKKRRADVVIDNSGTWEETQWQIDTAWKRMKC